MPRQGDAQVCSVNLRTNIEITNEAFRNLCDRLETSLCKWWMFKDYPKIWSCSAIFLKWLGQIRKPPQWKQNHVQLQASATSRSSQSLYCDPLWSAFPCAQTSMLWLAAWRSQANVTTGKRPVFEVFEASSVLYKGDGYIALLSVGSWSRKHGKLSSIWPATVLDYLTLSRSFRVFESKSDQICCCRSMMSLPTKSSWSLAASHGVRWSVGTAPWYEKAISRESRAVKVTTKSAKHIGKLVCVCINVYIYAYTNNLDQLTDWLLIRTAFNMALGYFR